MKFSIEVDNADKRQLRWHSDTLYFPFMNGTKAKLRCNSAELKNIISEELHSFELEIEGKQTNKSIIDDSIFKNGTSVETLKISCIITMKHNDKPFESLKSNLKQSIVVFKGKQYFLKTLANPKPLRSFAKK